MITITIKTSGAALTDDNGKINEWEAARIIRAIADKIEEGRDSGRVLDLNGNGAAKFEITED